MVEAETRPISIVTAGDSTFAVISCSGHGCMWEVPEQFNAAVLEYLAS